MEASAAQNVSDGGGAPTAGPKPLVLIKPGASRTLLALRDLWAYRELLYFLTWRDVKVRYKQTLMGAAWVVVQPLLMTLIFSVFLGALARVPTEGVPYPLLVYVGLLPWTFFSSSVASSGASLVNNSNLITKVYFPRVIVPVAAVGARLVDFAVAFVILVGMMLYYGVGLTRYVVLLPALVALTTLLALALGMLISALNVKYRDVGMILPVMMQLWMFVSPVLYPLGLVPEKWRALYSLNPLVGVVAGFRSALLGTPMEWAALGVTLAFTVLLLLYSARTFRRVERGFADVI